MSKSLPETTPTQMPAEMDTEQAKKTLEEAKRKRAEMCGTEINEVLKKYNCSIDVTMLISSKGNTPQFLVTPLE